MIITLDNGQSITIYEQNNLLKQLEPYIDKEIFELLNDKYSYLSDSIPSENIKLVTRGEDLIGNTIRYCNLNNLCDLDQIIIATNEGNIMVSDIEGGGEYTCPSANCYNKPRFESKIVRDRYFRQELLENNIVGKDYVEKLLKEDELKTKQLEEQRKNEKYQEYLKLKKEFEG